MADIKIKLRMKLLSTLLVISCLTGSHTLLAQDENPEHLPTKDVKYGDPEVHGMARSKGLTFTYERFAPYGYNADSSTIRQFMVDTNGNFVLDDNGNKIEQAVDANPVTVARKNRIDLKVRIPVWNAPNFKAVLGFKYTIEEYNFKRPELLDNGLYKNLEGKNLKRIGGEISVLKSFDDVRYLVSRVNVDLNGDYKDVPKGPYLRTSVALIYGWKRSENYSVGVGLQLGYNFGRQSIFPVVMYNRTLNERWGLEAVLPQQIWLRRNLTDMTLAYVGASIEGASYNINIDNPNFLPDYKKLTFRQSELRIKTKLEREIFDFIWVGAEAGYRIALSNKLVPYNERSRDYVFTSSVENAPYVNVNLYLVKPRKFDKD
jgi:hypothetical protein